MRKMSNDRTEQSGLVFESYEPPGEGPEASTFCHWTLYFNGFQVLLSGTVWLFCVSFNHHVQETLIILPSTCSFGWYLSWLWMGKRTDQGLQSQLQRRAKLSIYSRSLATSATVIIETSSNCMYNSSTSCSHFNLFNWLQTGTLWFALPGVCKWDQSEAGACIDLLMGATSEDTCFYKYPTAWLLAATISLCRWWLPNSLFFPVPKRDGPWSSGTTAGVVLCAWLELSVAASFHRMTS